MQRRQLLAAAAAPVLLQGCGAGAVQTFPTLGSARSALKALLPDGSGWRASGAWNLPQVLNHAAQSVEYSLKGFPEPKSALFQHTVGSAAFAVFDSRGTMSHGLDEPIPGAPALPASDALEPAVARLLQALQDFESFTGPLAPHFAYGTLDKAQYTRAHLMHLANHWTLVTNTSSETTPMSIKTATLNGVATIEIARPEKKNALTVAMYEAMRDALVAAKADNAVRAVLITGQPGIFTSGNDIEDFMTRAPGQGSEAMDSPVFQFMRALLDCDKPVVAAVTGAAIGIGTTMLLHCDFVYVGDEARLAMPFVALGLVPEFASSLVVPQLMGHRRAAEKLLLGDPFTPEQAVECGIANAVLPSGEVVNHARRVAERFNHLPPGAVRQAKTLMRAPQMEQTLKTIRSEGEIFAKRLKSPEAMEAFQAFFQKRKPDFSKF